MESRAEGFAPVLRFLTPFLLLPSFIVLIGCASSGDGPASEADAHLTKEMFERGFEDVEAFYITRPDLSQLAMAGMQQLTSLDPDIAAVRIDNQVNLSVNQQTVDSFSIQSDYKADDWGKLTAKLTDEAITKSPKLGQTPVEKIYEAMFTGVVSKLDPFSRYASAEAARENRAVRDGFGGIGVRISVEDGVVRVISVMHYTPAERMGLKRDDVIVKIDGQSTEGLSQSDVVDRLRGPVDSTISLAVKRADVPDPIHITLVRSHVVPETVSYRRDGDIAYLRIYSFNSETSDSLKRSIYDAKTEIGPRLAGYVLDLRDNPGGLLNQSVATANLFLEDGRIVSTHGRHPDSHQYFEATGGDIADGRPIVVLIDGNSASAAEIVAAALQDNGRAVVVGTNSYGKGTVQTVLAMPNKGEIVLTWARFHAPSGYTLHHLGVLPTICTSGRSDPDKLVQDLVFGRLTPVPTAQRNAVNPEDTAALDALRKTCPARTNDSPVDMEVAEHLLHQPTLFASAMRLAEPPSTAANDEQANDDIPALIPALVN
ncbi:S41 family peptidase [Dongia soli]|uniref:S41 family peptidase n=1 Tax=Dongia soli TaxID=600628 RepID=A0ABU5EGW5_9PROT|nr:S41 family peptidase [Dongia soli]MDY0885601.1 S41 family peptidase [Dongia soli]